MSSARFAARTVLAAAGRCFPVDRHASWRVCRWTGTAVPATVARLATKPGRWCARSGPSPASGRCPQSVAGSCRPPPDCRCDTTSADRAHRTMIAGIARPDRKSAATEGVLALTAARAAAVDNDAGDAAATAGQHAHAVPCRYPCAASRQVPPTSPGDLSADSLLLGITHFRSLSCKQL